MHSKTFLKICRESLALSANVVSEVKFRVLNSFSVRRKMDNMLLGTKETQKLNLN